jgi:hypothetical protein
MNDWVVCLGKDRGNELLHYRLGALRLIEMPLEPYREAVKKTLASLRRVSSESTAYRR